MKTPAKFLFLLVTAAAISVMVYGFKGTGAWFSGSAFSSPGFISSGTLDLSINEEPMQEVNLVPGEEYTVFCSFCARNTGSIGLKYHGLFEADESFRQDMLPYLTMKLETKMLENWMQVQEILGTPAPGNETDRLVYYFRLPGQDSNLNKNIISGYLEPAEEVCYRLSMKLDAAAPDTLRGVALDFFLPIPAIQTNNPGWE